MSLELNRAAGVGGVSVALASSNTAIVGVDAFITIEEETSVLVPLEGIVSSDELVTVTATLDDVSLDATSVGVNRSPLVDL